MKKKQSFENSLKNLENIVEELESGTPNLDRMLNLFEEGMKLTKKCKIELRDVERRVTTLFNDGNDIIEKNGEDI